MASTRTHEMVSGWFGSQRRVELTVVVVWQHCAPPETLHWLTLDAVGVAVTVIVVVGTEPAKAVVVRATARRRRVSENMVASCE